jgi:hypothetical protein
MRSRVIHVIVGCLVFVTGTAVFANPGVRRGSAEACRAPAESSPAADTKPAVALTEGRVVDRNGDVAIDLTELDPCGEVVVGTGMLRHLATGEEATAIVNDLAGADQLLTIDPSGISVIDTHGEVTHPTWSDEGELAWAEDLEVIRVSSADRSSITTIVPPEHALGAFSPYFTEDAIVAVLQEPSPATTHEDDGLDNLWRYDLDKQSWSKLTDFNSTRDRWSVIRTPVVGPDGSVLFVRITADPSQTREPRFELWRAVDDGATKVRALPGEMYLAGVRGDRLLWNAVSRSCSGWAVFAEGPDGLTEVGCGHVTTDPFEVDPDAAMDDDHDDGHHGDETGAADSSEAIGLTVLVGDFRSPAAARSVRDVLPVEMRGHVVGHSQARDLVRPGAWAVLSPVPQGTDPELSLERVRATLRGCRCGAWLAPVAR